MSKFRYKVQKVKEKESLAKTRLLNIIDKNTDGNRDN